MAQSSAQTHSASGSVDHDRLLEMYETMTYIRLVEERIVEHYPEQEMRCPVHLSIGQEATAAGVCAALEPQDKVFSTHRSHSHYLAKDGDLGAMMAEIYGKDGGCIGGRGGSMHLMDLSKGMISSVPIVASSIPLAVGASLAASLDGDDHVCVVFIGDASVEEGVFHESANFASLRRLPIVFICENNLYSVYTPLARRQPDRGLTALADAHGIPSRTADGNDVEAVYQAARDAVEGARRGDGPAFLQFDTYRWREHCGPNFDNHLGYRTEEEYQEWRERCPIERARARLQELGVWSEAAESRIHETLKARIDTGFTFAQQAPLPDPIKASLHVYA